MEIYYKCVNIWDYILYLCVYILWLCLYIKLCILLFKERMMYQDSNGGFNYGIKF